MRNRFHITGIVVELQRVNKIYNETLQLFELQQSSLL